MMRLALLFAMAWVGTSAAADDGLICCGGDEVYVLKHSRTGVSTLLWSWNAREAELEEADADQWFRSTDECKPYHDSVLITSSSGGVALIRRTDQRCLFLAYAQNAHSACLLPNGLLAVASSFGGDELLVYQLTESASPAEPIARLPLIGAHGVVWDNARGCLWALGDTRLLQTTIATQEESTSIRIDREWRLPTSGGHDLSPVQNSQLLFVTTNTRVYRFNKVDGRFTLDPNLGAAQKVKSVTQHPGTGEIVYHQAAGQNWWSDTIRFVGPRKDIKLPGRRFYKIRWDVPQETPTL